ncbi:MAG: hypothetical protein WBA62_03235 [Xanthobacteraceae bacterium]|jgi:hypothetical protein|nr:hypothetical protein [Hyphomicrobiales bacterium]
MKTEKRGERLQVMLSPEELTLLDDYRFRYRMPTRAAAVRELMRLGLAAHAIDGDGQKSSNYGMFARASDGYREHEAPDSKKTNGDSGNESDATGF